MNMISRNSSGLFVQEKEVQTRSTEEGVGRCQMEEYVSKRKNAAAKTTKS